MGKNDKIDIIATLLFYDTSKHGINSGSNYERIIDLQGFNQTKQFAQVWKHSFNDSTVLKIGSYQVYKNYQANNIALTDNTQKETQEITSNIPILISFLDFTKQIGVSEFSTGFRFQSTNVNNENINVVDYTPLNNPYRYRENVISIYANYGWSITESKSLSTGFRLEHTLIDYMFSSFDKSVHLFDNYNYNNFLYNISYTTGSGSGPFQTLSIKKQIQRPNYSYLNPFQNLKSNIIYASGDTKVKPSISHSVGYEWLKNNFTFYSQLGKVEDYSSTFTDNVNGRFIETYRNFDCVYLAGLGISYNPTIIEKKWNTKLNFDINYFRIQDSRYSTIQKSTPNINLQVNNSIHINRKHLLGVNYSITPTYEDGLIRHHTSHKLDITFSAPINNRWSVFLYAYDILRSNIEWEETTIPAYFYSSKFYNDSRSLGFLLRYNISGKTYKKRDLESIKDEFIDRL